VLKAVASNIAASASSSLSSVGTRLPSLRSIVSPVTLYTTASPDAFPTKNGVMIRQRQQHMDQFLWEFSARTALSGA
jgi:hypothetical protein